MCMLTLLARRAPSASYALLGALSRVSMHVTASRYSCYSNLMKGLHHSTWSKRCNTNLRQKRKYLLLPLSFPYDLIQQKENESKTPLVYKLHMIALIVNKVCAKGEIQV